MTMHDAANLVTVSRAEKDILNDPTMSTFEKMKALTAVQNAAARPGSNGFSISTGDIARGAIGAGLGYGAGSLLGKLLGVQPSTLSTFQNLGMGFGTLLNTGMLSMNKTSSEASNAEMEKRHAFRIGFVKAALDLGFIKEGAINPVLPLSTELLSAPVRTGLNVGSAVAANSGALLGQLTGDDATDVDMTKMQLEENELNAKADHLQSQRRAQILRSVLNKRLGR